MADGKDRRRGPGLGNDIRASWSESQRPVPRHLVQPVLAFMRTEAAGGMVMLAAALVALAWANSPWWESYERVWETPLTIHLGDLLHLEHTLREWVNDALMVIFFFVVGLEIKRELVVGELSNPRAAAMPIVAALGGMAVPALIYLGFTAGTPAARGWGIPMATDIAFAVGVLSLVGRRVPVSAKLFLLTLAVADDLGAILVIAVFYTDDLSLLWLLSAVVGLVAVAALRRLDVRPVPVYVLLGTFVWLALLESGVHATLAGVALGLLTPTRPFYPADDVAPAVRGLGQRVAEYAGPPDRPEDRHTTERIQSLLRQTSRLAREGMSPLDRLEHTLAPWSSYLVVPIFAFANAGVRLSADELAAAPTDPIVLGVFLGLLVGKFVGVTGATWLAVRLRVGRLPRGVTWRHVAGLALLAGIGFTVALFVTALSFVDEARQEAAKVGIFAASLLAGLLGFAWLRAPGRGAEEPTSDDDAALSRAVT